MPVIPLDFSNVETFDQMPTGSYAGVVDKIVYREAKEEGKFAQLMVTYMSVEEDSNGRKSSEFLSLSPKSAYRLKKWLDMFGLEDYESGLDYDEDTNELLSPDLVGTEVIFRIYRDGKWKGEDSFKTALVEVTDKTVKSPAAGASAAKPGAPARRKLT